MAYRTFTVSATQVAEVPLEVGKKNVTLQLSDGQENVQFAIVRYVQRSSREVISDITVEENGITTRTIVSQEVTSYEEADNVNKVARARFMRFLRAAGLSQLPTESNDLIGVSVQISDNPGPDEPEFISV